MFTVKPCEVQLHWIGSNIILAKFKSFIRYYFIQNELDLKKFSSKASVFDDNSYLYLNFTKTI